MPSLTTDHCSPSPTRPMDDLLGGLEDKFSSPKQSMWNRLGLRKWLGRDSGRTSPSPSTSPGRDRQDAPAINATTDTTATATTQLNVMARRQNNLTRRLSRKVGVGLPRTATFKRQISERRDRLAPLDPEPRRAVSADRRRSLSAPREDSPQPAAVNPRLSAPEVLWREADENRGTDAEDEEGEEPVRIDAANPIDGHDIYNYRTRSVDQRDSASEEWQRDAVDVEEVVRGNTGGTGDHFDHFPSVMPADLLEMELQKRWILNLSMHFRDRSEREKFFVTFAETPNRWRRVTISCDYRGAPPDSLEQDLQELQYQRDKSARIYEAIRESVAEIQFYETVTNLKLETRDGRLHVHVTEDVNEIIPYPPISCVGHLYSARLVAEHRLHFDAHLSGFVYKVRLDGKVYIKKEIPGPDTVDEFLYEINALHALDGSSNVIQFEGIVVDEQRQLVKGLLISYAEQGALVDILYERRGSIDWARRERWAQQIVQGLCEIHEAGYVQGDFTLSNIVVDAHDHARIIDINRRGCPVGWEPPEIAAKIESNQRISMYIGVKTDLYQLGMTLWALAMQEDEPERHPRPLRLDEEVDVPDYYRRLVAICLSPAPRNRLSAKELLPLFPRELVAEADTAVSRRTSAPDTRVVVGGPRTDDARFSIDDAVSTAERRDVSDIDWRDRGYDYRPPSAERLFDNHEEQMTNLHSVHSTDSIKATGVGSVDHSQSYSSDFRAIPVIPKPNPERACDIRQVRIRTSPEDLIRGGGAGGDDLPTSSLREYSGHRSSASSVKYHGSLMSSATSSCTDRSFIPMFVEKDNIDNSMYTYTNFEDEITKYSYSYLQGPPADYRDGQQIPTDDQITSLLQSALPINPALRSQSSPDADGADAAECEPPRAEKTTPSPTVSLPISTPIPIPVLRSHHAQNPKAKGTKGIRDLRTAFLIDSQLPINPAFGSLT